MLKLLYKLIKSDIGLALLIAMLWKIVMLAIGYVFDIQLNGTGQSLLHHTQMWDSNWYALIINDRYVTNPYSAAFYPMFPLLVGGLQFISFGAIGVVLAAQIINTAAIFALLLALIKLSRQVLGDDKRLWFVALVLAMPAAFFLHVFYSEAVFMALGTWAYLFALKRRWLAVGILLAILSATRLPALLFIGLCALEFTRAYSWDIRQIFNKKLLYFTLAPLGFVAYGTYLHVVRCDFLAMFHAYGPGSDWTYQIFNPNIFYAMGRAAYQIIRWLAGERPYDLDMLVNVTLPLFSLALLFFCSIYLLLKHRQKYLPLGVFGLVSIVMFTLNSNLVSVHRYVLPCLTIYVAVALFIRGRYQLASLLCIGALGLVIQVMLFALFIDNMFAG